MKNIRTISMGAAILAGAVGLIPTMLIFFGGESMVDGAAGSAILITEILFIVTIGLALFSAGLGMAINPAGIKGTAIGVGALLAVVLVSYLISSGADFESYKNTTESTSRWVSTGLNAFYIMFVLAIVAVLYSSVARLRK